MHGSLTFLIIPSSQIKPAPHRHTVVSLLQHKSVRQNSCLHVCNSKLIVVNPLLRYTYELTLTMTPLMTPLCRVGSWVCPSIRGTYYTLSARMTPTGGRPTGMETRTTSLWLDSSQVEIRWGQNIKIYFIASHCLWKVTVLCFLLCYTLFQNGMKSFVPSNFTHNTA